MTDTRSVQTMCPMNCHPTLCGMRVQVADDRLVSIAGDPQNPDSQGGLCMRGNAAHEIVDNDRRLLTPLYREDTNSDAWQEIGWEEALDLMAAKMKAVGREAVGFWQGHGNAANDYGFGLKRGQMERFANLYGCQHWNPAMVCWGMGGLGLGLTGALETSTKEDMGDHSQLIVLWGVNSVSQANSLKHVERAKRRGARIIAIDVRRTEISALADELILIRPGTDAALALAVMQVIVSRGWQDPQFVSDHTVGFEALVEHLQPMTPEWAAKQTGVPVQQILDLARAFSTIQPSMIVIGGSSIHKGANSWQAARAISCLPALTGNFGRPGGGIGPRHGARSHGAGFADISAAQDRVGGQYIPNQMAAIVEALETRAVKVLVTIGSNFLSSFPETERVKKALKRAELVVAYDIFSNQTIREAAHLVLPGTIWLEEIGGKSTNTHIYLSDRALPAAGQAKPAYELYRGLARRLGVDRVYPWKDQESAMNAVLDHPATGHATVAQLRKNGGRARLNISPVAYPTFKFHSPSGKIEFYSEQAKSMGLPALPSFEESLPPEGALRFAHGRTFAHFHSFYDHGQALPSLVAREKEPHLWMAPQDAEQRGVEDGAAIEISSPHGVFHARAKVTEKMQPGAVWMRDGWPGLNALTNGAAVLPETALNAFPFSVGQSDFGAAVFVSKMP